MCAKLLASHQHKMQEFAGALGELLACPKFEPCMIEINCCLFVSCFDSRMTHMGRNLLVVRHVAGVL